MANSTAFHIQPNMVFPSTKMEAVNKLITEGNLTRLINKLIDSNSYIIPMSTLNFSAVNNSLPNETLVVVPANSATEHLEFIIDGYYFDLGELSSVMSTTEWQQATAPVKLTAQILIDTTVENYPELFGETDTVHTETVSGSINFGTTAIPSNRRPDAMNMSIYKITSVGSDAVTYELSYDSTSYLLLNDGVPEGITFTSGYTVEYRNYANIINLYILDVDGEAPAPEPSGVESYSVYNLDLLYKLSDGAYFPMSSFVKFASPSIRSIDGGII